MCGQKQNLRAQALDPVLVPFLGRCLYFLLAFFFSLWFYLLSDDFLAYTSLCVCVCVRACAHVFPVFLLLTLSISSPFSLLLFHSFFCPCKDQSPDCVKREFCFLAPFVSKLP